MADKYMWAQDKNIRYLPWIGAFAALSVVYACTKPAVEPEPDPPAVLSDISPNAFIGTPKEAAAKLNETLVLKDYPQLAGRDGPTLKIRYRDNDLLTLTDDPKGCARYVIERAVKVFDPQTGRQEPIALVACHFGSTTNRYLVLPNSGKYAVTDDVAASPNGHFLATSDSTVTKSRGAFVVAEWPDITRRAEFPTGCTAIKWQDDSHLTANCWHSEGPNTLNPNESDAVFFSAAVSRDGGVWRMQATRWLQAETFVPTASTAPLPRFTAINKSGTDAPPV